MLDGILIGGYRSFRAAGGRISDLSRVNIFIGKNNSGKSNVLRFVKILVEQLKHRQKNEMPRKPDPLLDYYLAENTKRITVSIQIKKAGFTASAYNKIEEVFEGRWKEFFPEWAESFWLSYSVFQEMKATGESLQRLKDIILKKCSPEFTNRLTARLFNYTEGGAEKRATDIAESLHKIIDTLKIDTYSVEAFRRISETGQDSLCGAGLINDLRKLQSPSLAEYEAGKRRFATIVGFLRDILNEPEAKLEIPAEKDDIYVTIHGKVLPLDSLGTGIHELIILAAAVTLVDGSVFLIEEPEIHLHPELQKKFIRYIINNTKNQYFISSHSNAFFDEPGVNVYRCWLSDQGTKCLLASSAEEKHALLLDLGYRPSDILHANHVIWVEGPSDRIYINHWIKTKDPGLVEGLHYAIMFYGGRLLAHLSYDDPMVDEFICLSRLNRNASIVMDSDRYTAHQPINPTKRRIKDEFRTNSRLVWVTKGRTIENYLTEKLRNGAVASAHPKTKNTLRWGQFADLTRLRMGKSIDKVAVAQKVVEYKADLTVLDLESVIARLVAEIQHNNFG